MRELREKPFVNLAGRRLERFPEEGAILPLGEKTLWFLTGNRNKFLEARSILACQGIHVRHLQTSKVEIQNPRLESIARFALKEAMKHVKRPIAVEDSGLFVRSLGGFPGPYSSFVYETIGLAGVLSVLANHRDRKAYFQSTMAFGSPFMKPRVFTGRVKGTISRRILGNSGFGYDPIFIPDGCETTFGQTSQAFKNTKSHRAIAFNRFARWFVGSSAGTVKNRASKRALK